jgi:undecaprenyl-diphosphatase
MKKTRWCGAGIGFLGAFLIWTLLVRLVDVQPIGPQGSAVGFATLNGWFHRLTGVHFGLYDLTDWLGLVPIGVAACFGVLGLFQWIGRKRLLAVDRSILALGGFYGAVLAAFLFFEEVVINYRPVLIDGVLEASYPSSTTMLVMCVMPAAVMQLRSRMKNRRRKAVISLGMTVFAAGMVLGRVVSGVHWFTDIVGGGLLSGGLVLLDRAAAGQEKI